jgi:hypothetical protein
VGEIGGFAVVDFRAKEMPVVDIHVATTIQSRMGIENRLIKKISRIMKMKGHREFSLMRNGMHETVEKRVLPKIRRRSHYA